MAAVKSTMQALGAPAPSFNLPDVRSFDAFVSLNDLKTRPLLVMFICNHCPYVIHVAECMTRVANDAVKKGFGVVAISANDALNYPQDGPDAMAELAKEYGFSFPYLYDESQAVAQAYGASCTPDFFVFDADHILIYRGQMDAARPGGSAAVTGDELSAAINALHLGRPVSEAQVPSMGCSIKWKAGNEPDYL